MKYYAVLTFLKILIVENAALAYLYEFYGSQDGAILFWM